jgi:hypothetical protein
VEEEVTGDWRKLRNADSHDFCSSSNVIRVLNQGGRDGRDK